MDDISDDLYIVFEFDSGGVASIVQVYCVLAYSVGEAKNRVSGKGNLSMRLLEAYKLSSLYDGWKLVR